MTQRGVHRSTLCRSGKRGVILAVAATMLLGCRDEPGSEMAVRECLWVISAALYPVTFAGREVAVCGSISTHEGVHWLSDHQKPQLRLALVFPAASAGDPGVARVLALLDVKRGHDLSLATDGRYHGRLVERPGHAASLVVQRIDWLEGRPR